MRGHTTPRPVKETRPTMHGSRSERRLMSGVGALIRWNASHVPLTGDKPRDSRPRGRRDSQP
jgi:hypothetical protein